MNTLPNIMPITQARSKLGDLTKTLHGEHYIILTKGGTPQAALVDYRYLQKLQEDIQKLFSKTFIDPTLLPLTREFSDREVADWQKQDRL